MKTDGTCSNCPIPAPLFQMKKLRLKEACPKVSRGGKKRGTKRQTPPLTGQGRGNDDLALKGVGVFQAGLEERGRGNGTGVEV